MQKILFGEGKTIFSEGESSTYTYRIIDGSVDIVVAGKDGNEQRVASLGPDEVFGEMRVIDPAPRAGRNCRRQLIRWRSNRRPRWAQAV